MINFASIHLGQRYVGMHQPAGGFARGRNERCRARRAGRLVRRLRRTERADGRVDVEFFWERV